MLRASSLQCLVSVVSRCCVCHGQAVLLDSPKTRSVVFIQGRRVNLWHSDRNHRGSTEIWCLRDPRHTRTTREEKKQGFSQKVIWPPMALRIGLLGSSALHNDGLDVPVILQCRTPQETNPKGHWGPNCVLIKSLFFPSLVVLVCLGPLTNSSNIAHPA